MKTYKVILVGDVSVGKTNLLTQYVDGKLPEKANSTIGIEFKNKIIEKNGRKIRLQIWDTCGQEKFMSITKNYFRGCSAALFVFDVTKKDTFNNLKKWLNLFNEFDDEKTIKILIGNKNDLNQKDVNKEEIDKFAKAHFVKYFEISALNKEDIDKKFDEIFGNLKEKENDNSINDNPINDNSINNNPINIYPINDNNYAIKEKGGFGQINEPKNNKKSAQKNNKKSKQNNNIKSQNNNQNIKKISHKNPPKKSRC